METGTGVFIIVENTLENIKNNHGGITYKVNKTNIVVKKDGDKDNCCDIYGRTDGIRIYVRSNSVEYNKLKHFNFLEPAKEGIQKQNPDYYFQFKSSYIKPVLNNLFE